MIQLVRQLAGDARIVFDVGAAEGRVAGAYADLFPNAVVYAFEPTPGLCKLKSGPRIKVIRSAVLDKSGTTRFNLNSKPHINSVLDFDPRCTWLKTINTIKVPAVSLDDFCQQYGIEQVDVLKVDVQGAELLVLQGAAGLFARGAVKVVVCELQYAPVYEGQSERGKVGKFLSRHGFVMRHENVALRGTTPTHSDAVFSK